MYNYDCCVVSRQCHPPANLHLCLLHLVSSWSYIHHASCILCDLSRIVHKGSDPSSPQPSSVSLACQSIMFILRSTHSSDGCPAEMPSCTTTSEQSPALDRSAVVSNDHANTIAAITADYEPPLEHFKGSNYVGVIIVAAVIVSWLVVWSIRVLWRKRKGADQRRVREHKQKNRENGGGKAVA